MSIQTHIDPVTASVAAYSDHVDAYTTYNQDKVGDVAARFAALLPAGGAVLDAGCGPGRDLARFSALGLRPFGVDMNPDFVARAGQLADVKLADLRALPFADAAFHGVWACASLVHLPTDDTADALSELRRVVKPGGVVYVSVKIAGETGWQDTAHGRRWFNVWTPGTFADAVRQAGLTVEAVEPQPVFVDVWARA